jgi:hypothetical protein
MFEIPQQVIHETVDGETMIVRLDSGNYYSLNSTGGQVWGLIGQGTSGSQIIAELAGRYSLDRKIAEEQIELFLDSLIKEGLILPNGVSSDASATYQSDNIQQCTNSFEPPLLSKYSDMQELLILDPIHDISEAGWPNPKSYNEDNV